ncbi:PilZ domain-containing protein, partial [Candidatus Omnitrophota bacterium]
IRLGTKLNFNYRTKGSTGLKKKAVTKNISPGGIRGLVGKQTKKGDWLELNIYFPAMKKPISAIGKVIWTAGERAGKIDVGIKFEEINPEMKSEFLEHVCELMFYKLERLKV